MKTENRSAFPRRLTHETDAAAADFRVGGPVGVFPVEYPPHGGGSGPLAGTTASGGPAGTLRGSYDDWSHSQTYLHIVSHHDAVDDAEAMYRRAIAFGETEELSEFHAELSDLRDQLRLIAEMEALNIRNVL
mgnify:CR=1 FL=1